MILLCRRSILVSTVSAVSYWWGQPDETLHHLSSYELSLNDAVKKICKETPREFREAIQESSGLHLLYRGESGISVPTVLRPEPDLLLESTYNDPDALKYFICLEKQLASSLRNNSSLTTTTTTVVGRPSNGHIGTSKIDIASEWGNPVSVWPIGSNLSYIWPNNRDLLYPGGRCPDNDLVIDMHLDIALQNGKEVLFATRNDKQSSFITIPYGMEKKVIFLLSRKNFCL